MTVLDTSSVNLRVLEIVCLSFRKFAAIHYFLPPARGGLRGANSLREGHTTVLDARSNQGANRQRHGFWPTNWAANKRIRQDRPSNPQSRERDMHLCTVAGRSGRKARADSLPFVYTRMGGCAEGNSLSGARPPQKRNTPDRPSPNPEAFLDAGGLLADHRPPSSVVIVPSRALTAFRSPTPGSLLRTPCRTR